MNKPAPKEPSMDEILSSIRQIIADDDAAVAPKPAGAAAQPASRPFPSFAGLASQPTVSSPAAAVAPQPARQVTVTPEAAHPEPIRPEPIRAATGAAEAPRSALRPSPLALSPEQILDDDDEPEQEPVKALSFEEILAGNDADEPQPVAAELIDPEDIAFEPELEAAAEDDAQDVEPEPPSPVVPPPQAAVRPERPVFAQPATPQQPPRQEPPQQQVPPRPAASVAQAAPMPDPTLSSDMAEQLLEPTTKSAVKHAFSRLSGLSMVSSGVTIEEMMREMLRPMLKEWLDENLPAIVERMVEKEIARISRGVE